MCDSVLSAHVLNTEFGKRRWELQDEEEELKMITAVNKKIRGSKEVSDESINEVVVACLNWPQIHQ